MAEEVFVEVLDPVCVGDLGVVRRLQLLSDQGVPVEVFEPGVALDFLKVFVGAESRVLLPAEQLREAAVPS